MEAMREVSTAKHFRMGNPWRWAFFGLVGALILAAGYVAWRPGSPIAIVWNDRTAEGVSAASAPASTPAFALRTGTARAVGVAGMHVVSFTGHAFTPSALIVNAGDTVKFVDATNLTMRVGSRPEALSSAEYSAIIEPYADGQWSSFVVTLSAPGIWSYENLSSTNPRIFGTVYVR